MKLSRQDFAWAPSTGLITWEQSETLWNTFEQPSGTQPSFVFSHIAYYTGALVVIGAMGLGIMYPGLSYQRYRETIEQTLLRRLPGWSHQLRPRVRQ